MTIDKNKLIRSVITGILVGLIMGSVGVGCATLTARPPSAFEGKVYDVKTNQVPVVVLQTNIVTITQTNQVLQTNVVTGVVTLTNLVTIETTPHIITITNIIPAYEFTPKPATTDTITGVGSLVNAIIPGFGGLVTTIGTGLVGLWGYLRTKKQRNEWAGNLSQAIETARSVIKSLPNGNQVGSAFDKFLIDHQTDADLAKQIAAIVDQYVLPTQARGTATAILNEAIAPLGEAKTAIVAVPSNS